MKINLESVSKAFGTHRALQDVSYRCERVRSLVLIGPSGGGKSTLLRILAGLTAPDLGKVDLNDTTIRYEEKHLAAHRRQLGVVFQAFNLFPHYTAADNIQIPLIHVHGLGKEESAQRTRQVLERFGLGSHAGHKPAELSGGQRQRVAIARAIAIRPRLLLFDEPTSALDPEMTAEVLDLIKELREEGMDFVLVTHEMGFARAVADEVVFLKDGRIFEHGPAGEIFSAPKTFDLRTFLARVLQY